MQTATAVLPADEGKRRGSIILQSALTADIEVQVDETNAMQLLGQVELQTAEVIARYVGPILGRVTPQGVLYGRCSVTVRGGEAHGRLRAH